MKYKKLKEKCKGVKFGDIILIKKEKSMFQFQTKKEKTLFYILIIIFILIGFYICFKYEELKNFLEFLGKISSILILGTLIIGINQIKLNREQQKNTKEWNKKQLAITQIHKSRHKIKKVLETLDKRFKDKNIKSITDRKKDEIFTLEEIHKLMGNGEYSPNGKFEFDEENGRETRRLLLHFLGEYEYIAAATNLDIFDKKVVKDILEYNIVRTYCVFREYIKHIRKVHAGDESIYIELEKLVKNLTNTNSIEEYCKK